MKRGMPSGAQTPDGIIFLLALIFSKAPPRYPPHHGAHWAYTSSSPWGSLGAYFIEIFYLPSYSPDLNPDELLNRDLKAALSKTPAAKRNGELEEHAKSHMRSIQKQPEKIKALFHKESVKYAS